MMRSQNRFFLASALILLVLGFAIFIFSIRDQEPAQSLPATVNRDCAPWDGAAFTISIPYNTATFIYVSIWDSPDINFPSTFSFPDDSGQIGNAYSLSEVGPYIALSGEVSFPRVVEGIPLEGRFNLTSEGGERFEGRFVADWGSQIVYCG